MSDFSQRLAQFIKQAGKLSHGELSGSTGHGSQERRYDM
jgi:hypothetical protein